MNIHTSAPLHATARRTTRTALAMLLATTLLAPFATAPALAKTHHPAAKSAKAAKPAHQRAEQAEAERERAAEAAAAPGMPGIAARAWLLYDVGSGQVLASQHPEEKVEPASLTKVMTAYLVFAALRDGKIKLDQIVTPSTAISRTGRDESRMFIEPGKPVGVEDLVRGMIVQSGNDASVALAELVGGSEAGFVKMMNDEAARMGMRATHYVNATGMPDPQHTTTVRDLSVLATRLIEDFPQYYRYYSETSYTYGGIRQPNRNRLLTLDPTVDGMKTGHTESAGYCLISSAHRPLPAAAGQPPAERRLLSVLVGAATEAERIKQSAKLLNWGYEQTESTRIYARGQTVATAEVFKGASAQLRLGVLRDAFVSGRKGETARLKTVIERSATAIAPIAAGQVLGSVNVMDGDKLVQRFPLVALDAVPAGGLFTRAWDSMRLWMHR